MAEATQDAAKPARKKNAHYDVFVLKHDADGAQRGFVMLNDEDEPIAASSRRSAIAAAAQDLHEDDRYGTFATARAGEFQVLTRTKKTIVADDWGAA